MKEYDNTLPDDIVNYVLQIRPENLKSIVNCISKINCVSAIHSLRQLASATIGYILFIYHIPQVTINPGICTNYHFETTVGLLSLQDVDSQVHGPCATAVDAIFINLTYFNVFYLQIILNSDEKCGI